MEQLLRNIDSNRSKIFWLLLTYVSLAFSYEFFSNSRSEVVVPFSLQFQEMVNASQFIYAYKGVLIGLLMFLLIVGGIYYLFLKEQILLLFLVVVVFLFPILISQGNLTEEDTSQLNFLNYLFVWNLFLSIALTNYLKSIYLINIINSKLYLLMICFAFFSLVYFNISIIIYIASISLLLFNFYLSYLFYLESRSELLYIQWLNRFLYLCISVLISLNILGVNGINTELITLIVFLLFLVAIWIAINIVAKLKESLVLEKSNLQLRQDLGRIQLISIENERNQIYLELQTSILREVDKIHQKISLNNEKEIGSIEGLIKDIRRYAYNLFPPYFDQIEFSELIAQELRMHFQKPVKFKFFGLNRVSSNVELKKVLYRLFQEMLKIIPLENLRIETEFQFEIIEILSENTLIVNIGFLNVKENMNHLDSSILNKKMNLYLSLLKADQVFHSGSHLNFQINHSFNN